MLDDRLSLGQCREYAQHRDEIGDGARVDRHAAQRSAPHCDSFFLRRDLRAHFAQNVQHRAVALSGVTMQAFNAYASGAERAHAEKECRI